MNAAARIAAVARREYLERVRSKAFLIGTFVGPALLFALLLLPSLVMAKQRGKPLRLAVVDASGALRAPIEAALAAAKAEGRTRFALFAMPGEAAARQAVLDGALDGYLLLRTDALERSGAEYYGRNVSNVMDLRLLDRAVEDAFVAQRLERAGLAADAVSSLTRRLELKTIRLSAAGAREDKGASFVFSMLLLTLLYTTVLLWGQAVMTGVIEEKSSRVVELMVSSVPPTSLLVGKLSGVGAAGLTQLGVWTACLAALGGFGAEAARLGGAPLPLPEISAGVLAAFVVFFLLGYFLYSALYAAIGAAVNSIQEAQSLVYPVLSPLILGFMLFPAILQSPDGALAVALSLIPLLTPLAMFLRLTVLPPPAWQVALSIVLTLLSIALVTWAAARIYRVGILMYGKRPTLPELLRWISRP